MRIIRFSRSLRSLVSILFFLVTVLFFFGSSEHSGVFAQTTKTVTGLGPNTVTVNDPSFTLQIDGTGFEAGDTVILSGTPLTTNFISDVLLTAFVPTNALQIPSLLQVAVRPAAGGAPVGSQTLTVITQSPSIAIGSIDPQNVTLNQTGISLVVSGVGLLKTGVILIDGIQFPATVGTANSSTTLTATVTSDVTKVAGFHAVQVFDSTLAAGTQVSNLITLNVDVTNTKPVITSISPSTVGAGSDQFTLTITGTDFVPGAQVLLVATSLRITSFSATQINAIVTSDLIRTAGALSVLVENPGGVQSDDGTTLTVTAPVYQIQTIAPTEVFQGGPTVDVVIFGDNIPTATDATGVVVTMNGAALPTGITVKTRTQDQLVIEILNTADVLKTPGTVTFEVMNPATNTTDVRPFKIDVANRTVATFAGSKDRFLGLVDGPLVAGARFSRPSRMAESPVDHSLWIADQQNNAVRRIAMDPADPNFGKVQTIAGGGTTRRGLNCISGSASSDPADATGVCNTDPITVTPGVVGTASAPADLTKNPVLMNNPVGIAIDSNNVVYVTEIGNSVVRRITQSGPPDNRSYVVDIFAGTFLDSDRDTTTNQITRTGNPGFADGVLTAVTGSTATVAQLNRPDGIVLGKDINNNTVLYIADSSNFRIRRIFLDGPSANTMDTIAGSFLGAADGDRFTGTLNQVAGLQLALDGMTLNVADPLNSAIRAVNSFTGDIATIGNRGSLDLDGGPGVGGFGAPTGTAFTTDGKLIVADSGPKDSLSNNNAIRWLQNDGSIVTLAGQNGLVGGYVDGAQFTAQFREPRSVFVASDGTVYVCDSGNNVIRTITTVNTPKVFKIRPIIGPKVVRPQRRGNTGN